MMRGGGRDDLDSVSHSHYLTATLALSLGEC